CALPISRPHDARPSATTIRRLARPERGRRGWRRLVPSAETVLTVFIVGGLVAEAAVRARETTFPASGGEPAPLLGVLVPASAVLMMCRLALALGPVIAFPAEAGGLLSTPADRRATLLPRSLVPA